MSQPLMHCIQQKYISTCTTLTQKNIDRRIYAYLVFLCQLSVFGEKNLKLVVHVLQLYVRCI